MFFLFRDQIRTLNCFVVTDYVQLGGVGSDSDIDDPRNDYLLKVCKLIINQIKIECHLGLGFTLS